jgi:hypothetical protein
MSDAAISTRELVREFAVLGSLRLPAVRFDKRSQSSNVNQPPRPHHNSDGKATTSTAAKHASAAEACVSE